MKLTNKAKVIGMILIAISLLFLFTGPFSIFSTKHTAPLADKGELNLSDWDFNEFGVAKLDGYWEFYPDVLLSPQDFDPHIERQSHFIKVPDRWSNHETSSFMSDQGIGTYRLRVHVNPDIHQYGLKSLNIKNASIIFVNGKKVAANGHPAAHIDDHYVSRNVPLVAFFPADQGNLDIVIQVANLDYYNGGIIQSVFLGTQQDIVNMQFKAEMLETMGMSFLLLSGVYYVGIYIKRRHDQSFLHFAIFCIAYAFIIATYNEKILMKLFTFLPYMWVFRVKVVVMGIAFLSLSLFIHELSKAFLSRIFIRLTLILTICFSVLALITPTANYAYLESAITFSYLLLILMVEYNIFKALLTSEYGRLNRIATIFLFSGILLIVLQFISTLLYIYSITNNNLVSIFTLLLFLIGIAAMFAEQYSRAYSELEVMSTKLIELDKTKDEFLINTSHEFKTPLHGIINIAQVIKDRSERELSEKERENLTYIISLATRLSSLVNDIIDFQSLRMRSLVFHNKVFDVNGIIQVTIEVLKYMRKGEDIQLINHVPAGKYYVYSDENRFKQIITNLVSNALKYTEKGYVEITAEVQDYNIVIRVKDTGVGMDDSRIHTLFQRNQTSGSMNFTESTSSGLGLSISRLLVTHMGGELALEWSKLGNGSCFILKLPLASETELAYPYVAAAETQFTEESKQIETITQAPTATLPADNVNQFNRIKILIVDDEPSNIKVLQEIFTPDQYHTLVAYNGANALEIIKEHNDLSLVLLDVMMPGISGYEVCKQIRSEFAIYELPVLLLTVRNMPEDITFGLQVGANDFLVKPFNAKELLARVKTLLQMKEAVKDAIQMETIFLQSQIKPHFIYNALSVIMALCYSDPERAGKLLGELSTYLRYSFDFDPYHSFTSLKNELTLIKSFVELEKARFGDRLHVEMDIEETVLDFPVPDLIIQPIVENAIRHGLMKRISGGTVGIHAYKKDLGLEIVIRDDGVGIPPDQIAHLLELDGSMGHVGVKNVHKRLLNQYGVGLSITSIEGEGTTVTIFIPYKVPKLRGSS